MQLLDRVVREIDQLNESDPHSVSGQPAAKIYGQRMSAETLRLFPDASEELQIAARGQHLERWVLRRGDYPQGRAGYLNWRRDLAEHHATRVGNIMQVFGYPKASIDQVGKMLRKEGLKRDPEVQALEDVICSVFLTYYFTPFAAKHSDEKVLNIVAKTARKMSAEGRARVLKEFTLPEEFAACFQEPAA